MDKKSLKDRTVNFVKKHPFEVAYVGYIAMLATAAIYSYRKLDVYVRDVNELQRSYETLRLGVAAGHKYEFDAATNMLWDLSINPDKIG